MPVEKFDDSEEIELTLSDDDTEEEAEDLEGNEAEAEDRGDLVTSTEEADDENGDEDEDEEANEDNEDNEDDDKDAVPTIPVGRVGEISKEKNAYQSLSDGLLDGSIAPETIVDLGGNKVVAKALAKGELNLESLSTKKPPVADKQAAGDDDDTPVFDFDAINEKYQDAIIDGDTEEAKSLYKQMMDNVQDVASKSAVQAVNNDKYTDLINKTANDIFQSNKEYFNDPVNITIFNGARDGLMAADKSLSFADAMKAAAKRLLPTVEVNPDEKDDDKKSQTAAERKRAAILRNAKANNKQPPRPEKGSGNRANAAKLSKVASMTETEFDAMSEADKKRARGD